MYRGPASGLWTSPNPFSAAPAGSLEVADNVIYTAPTVIEPRRGFEEMEDSEFGGADSLANEVAFYGANILVAYDFTRIALRPSTGGFFDWAQTFEPNGANRMRFEPAARSIFFNPADGIRVFDGLEGFTIGTVADATLRALDVVDGAGDLSGSSEIVGVTSGMTGTIGPAPDFVATGTVYFTAVDGPFLDGEDLTGDGGWTGAAAGVDYPALKVVAPATDFIVGKHLAGETSGATAVIATRFVSGGFVYLGLSGVVGTFVAEQVAIGSSSLEPLMAGCPQGLNIMMASQSYDNGWQTPDTSVAYRFTICRKDAFGRIIEGPPSGRTVVSGNFMPLGFTVSRSGSTVSVQIADSTLIPIVGEVVELLPPGDSDFPPGDKTVTASDPMTGIFQYSEAGATTTISVVPTFVRGSAISNEVSLYLPDDVTVENFVRVYRSEMTLVATDTPSDEMWQCYESAYLSNAEAVAGVLTFDDVAPESVLEIPLYTNANTGDGTLAANYRPSLAEDIVYWQDRMWFLNTTERHSAQLALIGVGSPDGLQDGDAITILPAGGVLGVDDITFTAESASVGADEFQLFEYGDPGSNVQRTAQALAQAINDSTEDGCPYAFYVSSESGTPGKLLLQARAAGDAAGFTVYSSRATCWTPQLPSNTSPLWPALASEDNRHAARVYYSKLAQPEAVPLLNYVDIDVDNHAALKMCGLNYRLIVFKSDGVYFIPSGSTYGFQKLSDHVLIAPDSVRRMGDAVYFLSDQGLMMVDDSGVRSASIQIDTTLMNLGAPAALEDLRERTVACAYRSARQYLLWTIERDELDAFSDDNAQAFVRSDFSNGFTRYTFGVRAAAIDTATDKLVVAPTNDNRLWVERKTLTDADYADVEDEAIACQIRFNKLTDEMPATMKLTQQVSFLFKENGLSTVTTTFASEIHPADVEVELDALGWGEFSWGQVPWGGYVRAILRVQPLPPEVAECCQLSVGFTTEEAGVKFAFLGIDVVSGPSTIANHG